MRESQGLIKLFFKFFNPSDQLFSVEVKVVNDSMTASDAVGSLSDASFWFSIFNCYHTGIIA